MSNHCFWHSEEQWPADGAFRFCFECGHAWPTREDFLADARRNIGYTETDDLPFCPLCAHDF